MPSADRASRPPSGIVTFNADGEVPPPDPRLIVPLRACCLALGMSGAGECADDMLQGMSDLEGNVVLAENGNSGLVEYWRSSDVAGTVAGI